MTDAKPLILLPGMMADNRLLAAQQSAFSNVIVPSWPEHHSSDTIVSFAERMAGTLRPIGPCVVGGVSFGGIVALELARHLDSSGCILISSIRSPREMPFRLRILRPMGFLPQPAFNALAFAAAGLFRSSMRRGAKRRSNQMLASPFFSWATRATLRWRGCEPGVPIAQIHGDSDLTFPVGLTRPDQVVDDAGHMLVATHSEIVNEFIHQFVASRGL
jgi:pimeloyl-ACP methyl ester carboxylesterase